MTTYTAITNAEIDQDSPVTQPLMTALRDNPIAIAEADSSVALSLLPTVKLGTMTLTGASVSLTSLDLAPYRFLQFVFNAVAKDNGANTFVRLDVSAIVGNYFDSTQRFGMAIIDVQRGQGFSVFGTTSPEVRSLDTSITSATTTITFAVGSPLASFTNGTVEVYGVK